MKRSEVNAYIKEGIEFFDKMNWRLPCFAYWSMDEWRKNADKTKLLKELGLGWDITDYGSLDYENIGNVVYTIRNGEQKRPGKGVPYCEKLIYFRDGQGLPLHFHFSKIEDIINRAGGILVVQCYNSKPDKSIDYDSNVEIYLDGILHSFKPGELIEIENGGSITITPGIYHLFYCKAGKGALLAGEVSTTNDDQVDNYFYGDKYRFSIIDEDAPVLYPLCNEYDKVL